MKNLIKNAILLLCCLCFTAIQSCKRAIATVDDAIEVIDNGINKITNESQNWRTALEDVVDDLPENIHIAKEEASQLLTESIGASSSNIICVIDAIPTRVIRGLENIKAKLLGLSTPPIIPTVCQTSLSAIDLHLPEINRRKIIVNGYDFDEGHLLKLELQNVSGTRQELFNRLTKQSNYQYTIDIAGMDNTLEQNEFLILSFEDEMLSTFKIQAVIPNPPIIHSFVPFDIKEICPDHIGGDREFGGHGPNSNMRAELEIIGLEIYVKVRFHVKETQSDWTEALFEGKFKVWPTTANPAPTNHYEILSILSPTVSTASYTDTDHSADYPPVVGGLVHQFRCIGDTGGNDVRNCNGDDDVNLTIKFNAITIELKEL